MNILIVGLNPSPDNVDPKIPFVGTKSYNTLIDWETKVFSREDKLHHTNLVDDVITANSGKIRIKDMDRNYSRFLLEIQERQPDVIVGLGSKVNFYLHDDSQPFRWWKFSYYRQIGSLVWPHPSPSNRILNDKAKMNEFFLGQHKLVNLHRTNLLLRQAMNR